MFRFVHTADLHLDSPLKSLALRDPELKLQVGIATRETFARIVNLCIEEKVDALLIAGDLYDSDQNSMHTARFLANQMQRLHQEDIRVFIIKGNHDAGSVITGQLIFPDSVKIFSIKAETVNMTKDDLDIAIHGISFPNRQVPESLLPKFPSPSQGSFNIGMLHTSLGGTKGHDTYAPSSLNELQQVGFDYWALGHIHKQSCQKGDSTVVMPGIPQGRNIGEDGEKTVSLVSVDETGITDLQQVSLSVLQFERVEIDVSDIGEWKELVEIIQKEIQQLSQTLCHKIYVLRLDLQGATELDWKIRRDSEILLEEARRIVDDNHEFWIEKVDIHTRGKALNDNSQVNSGALTNLAFLEKMETPPSVQQEIEDYAETILRALPAPSKKVLGDTEDEKNKIVEELLKEGISDTLAYLRNPDSEAGP
ncbi:MAG: DNA repair exonuclease [Rhodobacteraceae bacterium]|nr:DNA repair exonuclease [Paracoccaceae bacterium]MCY4250573.1 DNA repair exonuclease [Paracoccaceae bacterium]